MALGWSALVKAVHLKLDELIHAIADADDAIIDAEDQCDVTLAELTHRYEHLHKEHQVLQERHEDLKQRLDNTDAA